MAPSPAFEESKRTLFPPIPILITERCLVAGLACKRSASTLGQLRLVFGVDVVPAALDAPSTTIAPALAGAITSIPEIQSHDGVVVAPVSSAAPVTSPAAM